MLNYKKLFLFVLILGILFIFTSCRTQAYRFDLEDLSDELTFDGEIINNEKTAKQYADTIMINTLGQDLNDYNVTSVALDSDNGVWVVDYFIDEETYGDNISLAIAKRNGEILKIWFGE